MLTPATQPQPACPPDPRAGPDPVDSGCRCIQCDYNLTGLAGDRCPECGWQIDWALVRSRREEDRPGTPVHRAERWRKIDQTLVTVLVMLLMPWRFARQLRVDESPLPALAVALLAFIALWSPDPRMPLYEMCAYLASVGTVILCQSVCLASLHRLSGPRQVGWWRRLRLWLIVSLYSTCFVGFWRLAGEFPLVEDWRTANFYPFDSPAWFGDEELNVSIMYYWWVAILTIFVVVRHRPRWLAVAVPPLLYFFSWLGAQAGALVADS